ncbi:MAG: macro domain-containing protein [Gemmataceae bacterium]|nr:macro domain-containing protein [Gemmataceae bacterium]
MFAALMRTIRRRRVATLQPFGPVGADALRLSLGDRSAAVADRLHYHFHGVAAVEVVHGNLLDLECDAIVSPANSFGDMSGGIDKAIDDFHRGEAQRQVVEAIREQFFGELPVGVAVVVELPAQRFPFVVAAPTMRIPGSVRGSLNAYLAMRAALVAVLRHNAVGGRRIRSLAVSGLGTVVGGIDPHEAAGQMRVAYDVIGGGWKEVVHPVLAPFALGRGSRFIRPG